MKSKRTKSKRTQAPARSRGFRLPIRVQISFLLFVFIFAVAVISLRSTLQFLEQDKVASVRELQTLRAGDAARRFTERIERGRAQLREASFRMLDPRRGPVQLSPELWRAVAVQDKRWPAGSNWSGQTEVPEQLQSLAQARALQQQQASSGVLGKVWWDSQSQSLHFFEAIDVRRHTGGTESEAGESQTVWIQAQADLSLLSEVSTNLDEGVLRFLLFDASALSETATQAELMQSVWLASSETKIAFSRLFERLPGEWRASLLSQSPPMSRQWEPGESGVEASSSAASSLALRALGLDDKEQIFISVASLGVDQAGGRQAPLQVLSFVERTELLGAFRLFLARQVFWVFALLGIGLIVAGLLARGLSRPIEAMVKATRRIETGDFSVRLPDKRRDELGDLAAAFNHMGGALDEREKALKEAHSALVQNEKLAALGTLSAGIAHEVKNPLAGILGNADLATRQLAGEESAVKERVLTHLEVIRKETKRCRGIIDSLMRFSRQEKAEFSAVDLEIVAWEAVHLMEHALNMAKVKVEKNFADGLWMVNANSNQVEQVLLNMLQNAGHAMEEGGTVSIGTEFYSADDEASTGKFMAYRHENFEGAFSRIYVRDQGVGMSEDVQKKIFEPFFTTKPKGVGTGLGLSVTMGILAEHKARVSIDSAPGEGTCFYIDFMAKEPRSPGVVGQLEEIRHRKSGGASLASDTTSPNTAPTLSSDFAHAPTQLHLDPPQSASERPKTPPLPPPPPPGAAGAKATPLSSGIIKNLAAGTPKPVRPPLPSKGFSIRKPKT